MKSVLKFLVIKIYSKLIIINLFYLSLKKKKYFYNHSLGFGDSFDYYIYNYEKIKKNKDNRALSFGNFHGQIVDFFFLDFKKIFFQIPFFFPFYQIISEVKKSKYFNPIIDYDFNNTGFIKSGGIISKKRKNFLLSKLLKKKNIKKNIIEFCNKGPYVCIFIKHYNFKIHNVFDGTNVRQTSNLKKIFLLIRYLKKKNVRVLLLGDKLDRGTLFLKKKIKNLDCLIDFSPSLSDQLFVAKNSSGYIGSHAGTLIPYLFFEKKIIVFDTYQHSDVQKNKYKKIMFFYKKVSIGDSAYKILSIEDKYFYGVKKFKIKETSFLEIRKAIKDFLFI
jgi:hypothetical protein